MSDETIPPGISVSPLYVYSELLKHEKECSRRWWSVMVAALVNLMLLVAAMAGMIVTLLSRQH